MLLPARNIWDIKIQCVCGIISASDELGVELFLSGNFGQASASPFQVVINPNRLYPIESMIRRNRRFAISILGESQRDLAIRLVRIRRRALRKAEIVGASVEFDSKYGIPFVPNCLRTLFCEVVHVLDSGDHSLMTAIVLHSAHGNLSRKELPLLYREVSGSPSSHPRISRFARRILAITQVRERLLKILRKNRPRNTDIAANTYREGGQTDNEIQQISGFGLHDRGRSIAPPLGAPAILKRRLGICVVGTGQWGSYHCNLFKTASPSVDLYVCGRNPDRAAHVARANGAKDVILGIERAVVDSRVDALSIVLPHDLHKRATELALDAGKHVLVEKPISTTLEGADAMIAAARRAGKILMVAEDMHFRPALRDAVRAIDRGDVGEPLYLRAHAGGFMRPDGWKADRDRMGGGVLMDLGVHYVRALRLLMGEPSRIFASRAMQVNTKMSGEDSVQLTFSSTFGWEAQMLLSWSSMRGHAPDLAIFGEKGTIYLWPGDPYIDFYSASPRFLTQALDYVRPRWLAEKLASPRLQRLRKKISVPNENAYAREAKEFLSAVSEAREPVTRPEDARRDLEIVLKGYESLSRQLWADIPSLPDQVAAKE